MSAWEADSPLSIIGVRIVREDTNVWVDIPVNHSKIELCCELEDRRIAMREYTETYSPKFTQAMKELFSENDRIGFVTTAYDVSAEDVFSDSLLHAVTYEAHHSFDLGWTKGKRPKFERFHFVKTENVGFVVIKLRRCRGPDEGRPCKKRRGGAGDQCVQVRSAASNAPHQEGHAHLHLCLLCSSPRLLADCLATQLPWLRIPEAGLHAQVASTLKHMRGNTAGRWTPSLLKGIMNLIGWRVKPVHIVTGQYLPFSAASSAAVNAVLGACEFPKGKQEPEVRHHSAIDDICFPQRAVRYQANMVNTQNRTICARQDWQIDVAVRCRHLKDVAIDMTTAYKDIVMARWDRLAVDGKAGHQYQHQVTRSLRKPWQDGISEHREVCVMYSNIVSCDRRLLAPSAESEEREMSHMQCMEPMLAADFVAMSAMEEWQGRVPDVFKIYQKFCSQAKTSKNGELSVRTMASVRRETKEVLELQEMNTVCLTHMYAKCHNNNAACCCTTQSALWCAGVHCFCACMA